MANPATGREVYVLGSEEHGNREMLVVEDGVTHDMPASAEVTYADNRARFPYTV